MRCTIIILFSFISLFSVSCNNKNTKELGTLAANAQEHMKFMGVPLDGTIDQFQSAIAKKGWTIDRKTSKRSEVGERWFDGKYANRKSRLNVEYDPQSKKVYACSVIIISKDYREIKEAYREISKILIEKYKDALIIPPGENYDECVIIPNTYIYLEGIGGLGYYLEYDIGRYFFVIKYGDEKNHAQMMDDIKSGL